MDEILKLLAEGKTPEGIYQDALAAVAQMNKDKVDKKVAEARDTLIKALDLYTYALVEEHISTEDATGIEELLKEIEKIILTAKNQKPIPNKSKNKKTDDEVMRDFLKAIMK